MHLYDHRSALEVASGIESGNWSGSVSDVSEILHVQNRQLRQSLMVPQEYDVDCRGVRLFYAPYYRRPTNPQQPYHPYDSGRPGSARAAGMDARVHINQAIAGSTNPA